MLKVLGKATSINVRKVLWTCDETGQPYEREDWGGGTRDTQDPSFLRLNPNGLVPVVVDGDFVLRESNTICRWLAGRHRRTDLLPAEPDARARVEQWMDWQATELNNAWRYAFMALVRRSPAHDDAALCADSIAAWSRLMALLDAQLAATGGHAAGASFTLADIVLGLATQRWYMTPFDKPELPHVRAYYDRLALRPGYAAHGRNGVP